MNLDNRIIEDRGGFKYWTFGEIIDILRRNDPDELFNLGFIKNFRDGQPIDGVEDTYASDYRMIKHLLNNASDLGLESYYRAMTELVTPGKYTYHLYHLVYRTMGRELHLLEYMPRSTYDDIYEIFISKLPQDGSINIFEELRKLDIDFLWSLRTDLSKYDIKTLCMLSDYKDRYPLKVLLSYLNYVHDQVKAGYDMSIILEVIMEVEDETND